MSIETDEVRAVTLNLPKPIYESFKRKADQAHRSVEDELLEVVAFTSQAVIEPQGQISSELLKELGQMLNYSDKALWKAARTRLSPTDASKLKKLNYKRQQSGYLTVEEVQMQSGLVEKYEAAVVTRSKALYLLKQRGHDISALLEIKLK